MTPLDRTINVIQKWEAFNENVWKGFKLPKLIKIFWQQNKDLGPENVIRDLIFGYEGMK